MKLGLTLLRIVVGSLFMGHGLQKLAGWFGGHGRAATAEGFEALGLRPGKLHAVAAGTAETAGGALVAVGAATPVGAAALTATMATAIETVHKPNGPWAAEGGYEYNLVLIALLFALVDAGPGPWSVDGATGRTRWGARWAVASLLAGLAGSASVLAYGRSQPAAADGDDEPDPSPAAV